MPRTCIPKTITYSGEKLAEMKEKRIVPAAVLDCLKETAEKLLNEPVLSVTLRNQKSPSGNIHEYASFGPYWWPDPDKEDGLPYIRRDGEINPESVETITFNRLATAVHYLALASYYFEESTYAQKAEQMLIDWFLDPETYMEPNADYGQAIPGICKGRGIGLIDFHNSHLIFNAIAILEAQGLLREEVSAGMRSWYIKFTDWMLTSENGNSEQYQVNNHGSWYDVQLLSAAIFTNRHELIQRICKWAYEIRIKSQVESDGKQPWELARTRAMSYSCYNIHAHAYLANMAEAQGYSKYWDVDPDAGVCLIKAAVDYLYPFIIAPDTFPYQELNFEGTREVIAQTLAWMDAKFPGEGYDKKAESFITDNMLWRTYPAI